jgi:hypothetical protein
MKETVSLKNVLKIRFEDGKKNKMKRREVSVKGKHNINVSTVQTQMSLREEEDDDAK